MSSTEPEKPPRPGIVLTIASPDCDKHIAWIRSVFNAQQECLYRSKDEKTVMHCSLILNGGYIYLYDKSTSLEGKGGEQGDQDLDKESKGVVLHLELEDPKAFWKNALNNGATVIEDLKEQYFGTVYGSLRDPFGFIWGFMKGGDCRKPGVIPYLILEENKCSAYVEWLEKALGGRIKDKHVSLEKDLIEHCSVELNGAIIYLADDIKMEEHREATKGSPSDVVFHMDLPNPKTTWEEMLQNNAKVTVDLKVQYWGDLFGMLEDNMGYRWSLCETPSSKPTSGKDDGVLSYILSPDCEKHIKWIETVLGGEVKDLRHTESKKIMHCAMSVNGGTLMLADRDQDGNEANSNGEQHDEKGLILHLNVAEPEAIWKKALGNGGVQVMELKKQFWGGIYGQFQDPFGYKWGLLKSQK